MKYKFNWSAVSGGAPYITVSSIALSFNSVSIEKLGNPKQVLVGFDDEHYVIGVKAFDGESEYKPYNFAGKTKDGWIRIGCRDFIKRLESLTGLSFSPAKRYVADFDIEERILYVEVKVTEDDSNRDGMDTI